MSSPWTQGLAQRLLSKRVMETGSVDHCCEARYFRLPAAGPPEGMGCDLKRRLLMAKEDVVRIKEDEVHPFMDRSKEGNGEA
jgi:hypothetical protein